MTKNFVEIIGFAGHDPKRGGNSDTARVRISIATTDRWRTRSGEKQEHTEWHTVIFWDRLADIAADYIRKGSHVLVSGSLKSREYEADGVKHTVWEIHARELLLLDPRTSTVDETDEPTAQPQTPTA
jgi:single-strand DNA-binding protein